MYSAIVASLCFCVLTPLSALPVGCTYDSTQILYTCSARSWSLPLAYADFDSVEPQRIVLEELSGTIAANTFSGFTSINTGNFDSKYVPSLYMICYANSDIILDSAAFTDFSFIDEVKIIDCGLLSIPSDVFSGFGDVNLFHITGGSITNMHPDGFKGLNVKKMTQYSEPLGEFAIINSQVVGSTMATGALFNLLEVERVRLERAHLMVLHADMFSALKKLKYISLNDNIMTKLETNMFTGLDALSQVDLYGISWFCTCGYLWFIEYSKENNITIGGDIVCQDPADYLNKRATTYYQSTCVEYIVCDGQIGIAMGGNCMTLVHMLTYGFTLIVCILSCVAFGLTVHSYRKAKAAGLLEKNEEPRQGRKLSGSTWNKIDDDGSKRKSNRDPNRRRSENQSERRHDRRTREPSDPSERRVSQNILRSPRSDPSIHNFDF
ncbi:uncharacterized protein LOC127732370 [Mytilus californianus]|uniref:uncharacterized protein LOC127732370 n=1 Tax=Mytilus californianus TaxID=6549 RepID=UPI0022483A9E|nr:uncharacterized protein LOC127732370 [Mytilus californianus]